MVALDDLIEELLVEVGVLVLELGLAYLLDHLVDEVEHGLELLVRLHDALVHDVVGHLVGGGLNHDDLLVRRGDGDGHPVVLALGLGGVEEVLVAVPAEADAGDGAVPGDVGNGHGGAGADHGGYLGGAVAVDAEDLALDGDVVPEVAREERAHRAVDEAAGQDGGQAGTALAAHEAAGDAAHGVELLVEVDAEGEVVDAVARARGGGHGDEDGGLAVLGEHRGVGQLGHAADLHAQRAAAVVDLIHALVGELLVLDYHSCCSFHFAIGSRGLIFGRLRPFCAHAALLSLAVHKVRLRPRALPERKITRNPLLMNRENQSPMPIPYIGVLEFQRSLADSTW